MNSDKHGLIIDLNYHRPGRSLKQLMDAGADGFILRIGGPSQWVEGDYKYQEDPTWRPYMDQAAKLGITSQIGGYIVHNPFAPVDVAVNDHIDLLNQWTSGGYMPAYFVLDHEIATTWRGGQKITCTPYNLVRSLNAVTDAMWKKWHKMVMIYTGRWFIDQNGFVEHMTYLDNINKSEKQRPVWYAGYPAALTKQYDNLKTAVEEITSPSSTYIGKVLQCGSYRLADLWQFTDRLQITGDNDGVDASITWGTLKEYWAAVGVTASAPQPPEPQPGTDDDLKARIKALEDQVAAIVAKLKQPILP